jgi:hypothetical protein
MWLVDVFRGDYVVGTNKVMCYGATRNECHRQPLSKPVDATVDTKANGGRRVGCTLLSLGIIGAEYGACLADTDRVICPHLKPAESFVVRERNQVSGLDILRFQVRSWRNRIKLG